MVEKRPPVHNSEVYLLTQSPFPAKPPPSPPSPVTPAEDEFCAHIEKFGLISEPAIAVAACESRLAAVEERLNGAVHVLSTETRALQSLTELYSTDRTAREGFDRAVEVITRRQGERSGRNGKLVVIGVGKSGHIAKKLVATFNSLAIQAVFLHPTEALHGDLGQIGRNDTILLITFSGKTQELLTLLPHLGRTLPMILLTSHTRPETCEIIRCRPDTILLPAPIHESETQSFGVCAPTTSTTVALTVGDALAIVASQEIHAGSVAAVFAKNHPGGAIGAALRSNSSNVPKVRHLAVSLDEITCLDGNTCQLTGADILRAGYACKTGWVRLRQPDGGGGSGETVVSPCRIRQLSSADLTCTIDELEGRLVTHKSDFVSICANTTVRNAAEWISTIVEQQTNKNSPAGSGSGLDDDGVTCGHDSIIAVMEKGECVGLLEVATLLQAHS
ncbi:putative arabinose 5-phosphate isomerase [Diplogelasinospora grovesii]|uniref:Arabinose 5-phosphate isomerase n=1 Tax=Diplogelasinospora grovesii TaxID=303347 RepID=A0AAN6NCF8_9PEZI|nr:putative arabinose 5-phosphate isomerase [Diplogelasinospora grovesii]